MPLPNLQLQDRDLRLLRALFESRVMTLAHASTICFDGRAEAAKKRLQKLKAAGYIAERPRRRYQPSVLILTRKSFRALRQAGALAGYPPLGLRSMDKRARVSPLTLDHELAVMDVKAAICAALREGGTHTVEQFVTWPLLCAFRIRPSAPPRTETWIKPDGFLHIRERTLPGAPPRDHLLYVEVDRSTEAHATLCRRATAYLDHYRTGGLAVRFGSDRQDFKRYPFRVLFVFNNAERRNNAAVALLGNRPPLLTQTWLTTIDEIRTRPLDKIWVRPLDYRDGLAGTPFDPAHPQPRQSVYRRNTEREQLIERLVRKHRLLGPSHI